MVYAHAMMQCYARARKGKKKKKQILCFSVVESRGAANSLMIQTSTSITF